MADLTVNPNRLRPMEGIELRAIPMIAAEAITKGQAVYQNATGFAAPASAAVAGTLDRLVGIATSDAPAGSAVDVVYHGRFAGFDLSNMDPGDPVFVSDTAGALADAAGTAWARVGRVFVMTDRGRTKFLFVDVQL